MNRAYIYSDQYIHVTKPISLPLFLGRFMENVKFPGTTDAGAGVLPVEGVDVPAPGKVNLIK